jgi:type IV pilus assembly protein PilA
MRKQKGFSLIELLIVVAIILIIAAIAIPSLMRARMSANESSAAAGVRTISTAEVTYFTTYQVGYADTLAKLGTPTTGCAAPASTSACLIDSTLTAAIDATHQKSGYIFDVKAPTPTQGFETSAYAATWNRTGLRTFCATEDNVVHVKVPTAQDAAVADAATCTGLPALNN